MPVKEVTLEEFMAEGEKLFGPDCKTWKFKCVICKTPQSMEDLVAAGASPEEAEGLIGFSCIGRLTEAGEWKKDEAPGRGCNWSLGGLFQLHDKVVIMPDGHKRRVFEFADPEEQCGNNDGTGPCMRPVGHSGDHNNWE